MIYTPMSVVRGMRRGDNLACTKIIYKGFEISIAMDDSCGRMSDLTRADIRVSAITAGNKLVDVTKTLMGTECIRADGEMLHSVFDAIDKTLEK